MLDVMIRGGHLADGTGAPLRTADVGIQGDRIIRIGELRTEQALITVDATGLVVSPGFIDVHTHSDLTLLVDPKAESAVRQGVTTHVFPNCGVGAAPAVGDALEDVEARARPYGVKVDWRTVGEYFERVAAARPSINVVPMVAQGTVRMAVMGSRSDAPSRAEMEQMKEHVDDAMRRGARGMCSGLRYVPSGYASIDELVGLANVVKEHGGLYATHMRSEGDNGEWSAAIDEALAVGRGSGLPVQISHLKALGSEAWGKSGEALARIANAQRDGVDVTADQYPYEATSASLFVLFPQWSQEGGIGRFLERVADPSESEKIRAAFAKTLAMRGGGSRMAVSAYEPDRSIEGLTLTQVAVAMRVPEFDAAVELLRRAQGRMKMVYHSLESADIERIFREPCVMVASDGAAVAPDMPALDYEPHPRNYGCFPKVLGDFVRTKRLASLEEAIRKMTSLPASRFGLERRGSLLPGWRADVTVFDPATIADRATFQQPNAYPAGIGYVFVNGEMVVDRGEHTGKRPGQVLSRPRVQVGH